MRRPSARTLARLVNAGQTDSDEAFFADHPDRLYRIREPRRSVERFGETESEMEFRSLGSHARDRRRIIVHKVNPVVAAASGVRLMRIPFLLFADETVEDRDDILGPIFHEIMRQAGLQQGVGR